MDQRTVRDVDTRAHQLAFVDDGDEIVRVLYAREGRLTLSVVAGGEVQREIDLEHLAARIERLEDFLDAAAMLLHTPLNKRRQELGDADDAG
jgi:hypothetical protein